MICILILPINHLPNKQLQILDEVRLKQVTCLSDIVSVDGIYLDPSIVTAIAPMGPTPYDWPRSIHPNAASLIVWKHFLRLCFTAPHTFTKQLIQPLGHKFTHSPNSWEWWFSPSTDSLYRWTNSQWSIWNHHSSPYRPL